MFMRFPCDGACDPSGLSRGVVIAGVYHMDRDMQEVNGFFSGFLGRLIWSLVEEAEWA